MVIIDRQGKVARIDAGAPSAAQLGQQLDQALGGTVRAPGGVQLVSAGPADTTAPGGDRTAPTTGTRAASTATTDGTGCCP